MFGRKKEKEIKPITHHMLGEITIFPSESTVKTAKCYNIVVFGKQYSVYLYVNSPEFVESHEFSAVQEQAISYFSNSLEQIGSRIENQLNSFFGIDDFGIYNEKLSVENITISCSGEIGVFLNSAFSDEDLSKIDPKVIFTDAFGIVLYPNERMLYNEQECYSFDI